jgi:alkylhydroperoxidase/carboxymuconolactone decarboxylase family protein YurZ
MLPIPDYFSAKGMLRDQNWIEAYISTVLQWPKSCRLSVRDRQLIGLAKSLAFSWEPGILNHTDLALRTGSSPEQVSEVLKTTAMTVGLAQLDRAIQGLPKARLRGPTLEALKPIEEYFGEMPRCFRSRVVLEDRQWLEQLLQVSQPAYDARPDVIDPHVRALVCLAAAAVLGWEDGIRLYGIAAKRFGARDGEISDVVKSVFKTAVSNAMAEGFRVPCHIPRLEEYRTILSAYAEKGAFAKRKGDRLSAPPRPR